MLKKIILYFLIFASSFAQQFKLVNEFGNFEDAKSVSINNNYKIFVSDISKNEIFEYDTTGKEITSIGGYGWDIDQFDSPVKIFATTLNVYIADKNNNRILFYDKDLNYISQLNSDDIENQQFKFEYPTACVVSNQGDLFILDSDNSRILKFDLNGNFLFEIGNQSSGKFALSNPVGLALSGKGKLFTSDGETVFVFDLFGKGLLKFKAGIKINNLNFKDNYLTICSDKKIKIYSAGKVIEFIGEFDGNAYKTTNIKDAQLFNKKLYVLTEHSLKIYSIQ